jgi:hypothetical protein
MSTFMGLYIKGVLVYMQFCERFRALREDMPTYDICRVTHASKFVSEGDYSRVPIWLGHTSRHTSRRYSINADSQSITRNGRT